MAWESPCPCQSPELVVNCPPKQSLQHLRCTSCRGQDLPEVPSDIEGPSLGTRLQEFYSRTLDDPKGAATAMARQSLWQATLK